MSYLDFPLCILRECNDKVIEIKVHRTGAAAWSSLDNSSKTKGVLFGCNYKLDYVAAIASTITPES